MRPSTPAPGPTADALEQVVRYLEHAALLEGWLVMFDLRKGPSWPEKLKTREVEHRERLERLVRADAEAVASSR